MTQPRFVPSRLDQVENIEEYRPGGYHPIFIGDLFANGRYKVVHKLGYGHSSTVWLARDQLSEPGRLVTLKAMRADASSKAIDNIPDLFISQMLQAAFHCSGNFQIIDDHFAVHGPNGTHRFLVSPFAGPSVLAMSNSPGRVSGSRRLRGDLARKVARQTAKAIHSMHNAGLVHGDVTTSNILFRVSEQVLPWSDVQIYSQLGPPVTEEVRMRGGCARDAHAPAELVEPIDDLKLADASLLQESVVLIDFGQSYTAVSPPQDYQPGTLINYFPPEVRFEGRAGMEMDVWTLGCAIFEIRAGSPLFEPFLMSNADILRQTVQIFGRLPDRWWSSFAERNQWFEDNGEPKSIEAQKLAGALLLSAKSSIRERLSSIGKNDDPPSIEEGPMIEKSGVKLSGDEVELMGDLLERMLKYRPEDRITIQEVISHPWFSL